MKNYFNSHNDIDGYNKAMFGLKKGKERKIVEWKGKEKKGVEENSKIKIYYLV